MKGWLAQANAAVDAALTDDLTHLSAAEVLQVVREVEALTRRLAAVDVRSVAELDARGVAGEYARAGTADLLVSQLCIAPGEAKARVGRAGDLGPRRSLTGQSLPPLMPETATALADGRVSLGHVRVITGCLEQLPAGLGPEAPQIVESTLIEAAGHEHPGALARTATMLLARLDPDGIAPRKEELQRRRDLTLTRYRDSSGTLRGRLTVEATAIWDTIVDALSAPVPDNGSGERDTRSAGQRRHDGLVEAGQRLLRSGSLPAAGGVPVTVVVRTTAAELAAGAGFARTSRGDLLSIPELVAASSDAEILPVVTSASGAVLSLGRSRRLASRAQRLALASRDGGCCFPGCSRPAAWTEVHHVLSWQDGGATDVSNLCLLCRYHHRSFESALGFNGSSQHLILKGVVEDDQMEQVGAAEVGLAGHADDPARNPPAVLACDCFGRRHDCFFGCGGRVAGGGAAVVRRRWRRAATEFDRALGPVSVLRRAGRDRDLVRPADRGAGDRPSRRARSLDDFSRVAA